MSVRAMAISVLATALGAQFVHMQYKPIDDLPEKIEEEMARLRVKIAEIKGRSANVTKES